MLGKHLMKHWAVTQATVALSSGEAELYAMVRAAAEAIGFRSLCRDLGVEVRIHLHSDSSAAIGISGRSGIGRVRHLEVAGLWIQDRVRLGDLTLHKIHGPDNPADLMTKHVTADEIRKHCTALGVEFWCVVSLLLQSWVVS